MRNYTHLNNRNIQNNEWPLVHNKDDCHYITLFISTLFITSETEKGVLNVWIHGEYRIHNQYYRLLNEHLVNERVEQTKSGIITGRSFEVQYFA